MRAWELNEYTEDKFKGGGWFNINTNKWVSTVGYHTLTVFFKMDKFGLTPEKMKAIPAFAKWFKLDWAMITGNDDPEELESWWMDIDPHGGVPTLSGKMVGHNKDRSEYLLDGDQEIIAWMNDQGWVRVINDKQFTDQDLSIQGKDLNQILKAARFFDKHGDIESLYFDTNNFENSNELEGDKLRHFLRYGNLNFGATILESQEVTQQQLDMLDYHLDRMYSELGIDVAFSKHFIDRVNDVRNEKQITIDELQKIFTEIFKKYKNRLKQEAPGFEAVMNDISTDLNIPFVFDWDEENNERDMVTKTVMRKSDFHTSDERLVVGQTSKK